GKPPEWWEKQKGSRGIRRGQWYRLVFQFPIRELKATKDAINFTTEFLKSVSEKYGAKAEQLAREMAGQAKGKKIRNVEEALKTYEKYRADINKKINAKDRAAIAAALESVKLS
ncbi:colicin-like pore-forming protein, partial [Escherichia coli]|uniref:colicin-like pore-forming protein n=1 Tax=Escherichia coli TaxID=562 RepID=UPI003F676B9E